MIQNFGSQIAERQLGKHWVDRLVERHHVHVISNWATDINSAHHQADSAAKYIL
jgi:hypothetical protein